MSRSPVIDNTAYTIVKRSGHMNWSKVPILKIDNVLWMPDAGIRAEGQLCYDEEGLYVHMRAIEEKIRAEYTEPLSPVYCDSCLEFFFQIEGEENYFNFEINPNGCLCIQYGKEERIDIVQINDDEYFAVTTNETEDGWEAFYKIPLKFIRLFHRDFAFDRVIMANMYKCGDRTVNRHYLAWKPISTERPNFHTPQFFGRMTFE